MAREVLVVEDEPDIRRLVVLHLERDGFRCRTATSGPDALREVKAAVPDLVVLDLMLPELDGLEVCRRLRRDTSTASVPIIMLTAKSDEVDRIVGLEIGADDYVAKPFSPKELVARVRAVLRRAHPDHATPVLSVGPITLDPARHVASAHGQPIVLTPKEFDLLQALLESAGRVLARVPLEPRVGLRPRGRDRVAHGRRARPAPPGEAGRRGEPDRDGEVGRVSARDGPAVTQALVHFLRRSIARKLTLTLVGFVAVTIVVAGLYLTRALEAFAVDTLEARLVSIGRLLHDEARALIARHASPAEFHAFALRCARPTASRITVIAADGGVLGDSEVAVDDLPRVENHRSRPEVLAALAGGIGRDRRTSATIGASLLYVALPIGDGARVLGVIRVALPVAAVTSSYAAIHRVMLAGGLVALAVAFGIGLFVARRVTKPVVQMQTIAHQMSEGDFTVRAPIRSPDEIGALGRALNGLAARLREKVHDLGHEQAKATAILDGR